MPIKQTITILILILFSVSSNASERETVNPAGSCNQAIRDGGVSRALTLAEQQLKLNALSYEVLLCKGRALDRSARYAEAVTAFDAAGKRSATSMEHAVTLTLIANTQKLAKQYTEALSAARKSLAIVQPAKNKQLERLNLNQIGDLLVELSQLAPAMENYLVANKLAANEDERADGYARIAALYSRLGKHDQAIEFQIKTIIAEEHIGDFEQYVSANLEMGRIYTLAGEYANAEKTLDKIIELVKEQGAPFWEAKADYYQALAKAASGQLTASRALLENALLISKKIDAQALNEEISLKLKALK
jgi:tetratricopeptide (TPR) repeat protein